VVQDIRSSLGLDRPILSQFVRWLGAGLRGDFGKSFYYGTPALTEVMDRFPSTIGLATASIVVSTILGVLAGVVAALLRNTILDRLIILVSLVGISVPAFWSGLMLMWLFSVNLKWLPTLGAGSWKHFILPSITLGLFGLGLIARMTRASVIDVMREDFIRTAHAKGAALRRVVMSHAMKNALIPVVTIVGLQFGGYLGRAVVTETVFAWPGIGRLVIQSIQNRDFTLVQVTVLVMASAFMLVNLVVDLAYAFLDPRIRYG
jgi:ABC-type dipeptide/oligopeptide/nickel transport system permease component